MSEGFSQPSLIDSSVIDAPAETQLPGAVLRAEREMRGLTIEAVAQATRFGVRQVVALESDDYASLPGMTTVRGFVRSYAKYLQLDVTPLLGALDAVAPLSLPEVRPPANMGEATPKVSGLWRGVAYFFAVCVVAFLMLTVYGYVIQQTPQSISLAPNSLQNKQPVQGLPAKPTDSSTAFATEPSVEPAPPAPAPQADVVPVVADTSSTSVVSPTVGKDISSGLADNPATLVAQLPAPVLSVIFDGASWIEVRDATRKVVLSGEFPAGVTQKIDGKPPFQLWLGKASAVRVFFGERSIDLQPFTRAGVARLTVE